MLKRIFAAEQKARAHRITAHGMVLAFIDQLDNKDLSIEEWDRMMNKLQMAEMSLAGRYAALWEFRVRNSEKRSYCPKRQSAC